jgi:hypothetical protein
MHQSKQLPCFTPAEFLEISIWLQFSYLGVREIFASSRIFEILGDARAHRSLNLKW